MVNHTGRANTIDTFIGTATANAFRFAAADLDGDTVAGRGGNDLLHVTTAGVLGANALANVSEVERIALAPGGNDVTLLDANFAGIITSRITVFGGAGNDTIRAGALTGTNGVEFRSGDGLDKLYGGAGADIFRFKVSDLYYDTVVGGEGTDRLVLQTAGRLDSIAMNSVSGIEIFQLANGTNYLQLATSVFAGVEGGRITVYGNSGNDTISNQSLNAAHSLYVVAGGGFDALTGGAGNDTFRFTAAEMNGDYVFGAGGLDSLQISVAGVLAADALSRVSGVETIALAAGSNTITVLDTNFNGVSRQIAVVASDGNDRINASGLTGTNAVVIYARTGLDFFRGGEGPDEFRFAAENLQGDTVQGGGAIGNLDQLTLTTAGTVGATALANVSGVEKIELANGTNSLTLASANFNGTEFERIRVTGGTGDDTVDASTLNSRNFAVTILAGSGLDVLRGGQGADVFRFDLADLDGDTVSGGGGFFGNVDSLELATAGTLGAAALANVSGVERFVLANGPNDITFAAANFTSLEASEFTVRGSNDSDTLDLSAKGSGVRAVITAGAGLDSFTASTGGVRFIFEAQNLYADTVTGGTGGNIDTLEFTTGGLITAAALANVTGVEAIALANANTSISLSNNLLTNISSTYLQVNGQGGADTINASALTGTNAVYASGGAGNDTLIGGAGGDTLTGAIGLDTLTGGGGEDYFYWQAWGQGLDTLTDFTSGTDKLQFFRGSFLGSNGVFDTLLRDNPAQAQSLAGVEVYITDELLSGTDDVLFMLDNESAPTVQQGLFVIAANFDGNFILYYLPDISGQTQMSAYEVADLGTETITDAILNDFVFL